MKTDEHPVPERRHDEEAFGFWMFRRRYPLSSLLKAIVLLGLVAGTALSCWTFIFDSTLGKQVVDKRDGPLSQLRDTAAAAFGQSRENARKLDSLAASVSIRVSKLEDAVLMLAELKCKELRDERVAYMPPTCTKILRTGDFTP
jgi:hypothetical protein